MTFIQIVEAKTSRVDEILELTDKWVAQTDGRRTARHAVLTEDRDRPGTFLQIVEFPSYEVAMENSALPETAAFAEQLAKLCDEAPTFRNLEVRRVEDLA